MPSPTTPRCCSSSSKRALAWWPDVPTLPSCSTSMAFTWLYFLSMALTLQVPTQCLSLSLRHIRKEPLPPLETLTAPSQRRPLPYRCILLAQKASGKVLTTTDTYSLLQQSPCTSNHCRERTRAGRRDRRRTIAILSPVPVSGTKRKRVCFLLRPAITAYLLLEQLALPTLFTSHSDSSC